MGTQDTNSSVVDLPPLDVKCNATDCPNGRHCYRQNRKLPEAKRYPDGVCWDCGTDGVVDWDRVRSFNLEDQDYVIEMLRTELIRFHYWDRVDVHQDHRAINYALRKGRIDLRDAVMHRLNKYFRVQGFRDGAQTPKVSSKTKQRNIVHYAQHATATCCRKCMAYWYGIDVSETLTDEQVEYFADLIMRYIDAKLPDLPDNGTSVSPVHDDK